MVRFSYIAAKPKPKRLVPTPPPTLPPSAKRLMATDEERRNFTMIGIVFGIQFGFIINFIYRIRNYELS